LKFDRRQTAYRGSGIFIAAAPDLRGCNNPRAYTCALHLLLQNAAARRVLVCGPLFNGKKLDARVEILLYLWKNGALKTEGK
jgi:hypothetical protein